MVSELVEFKGHLPIHVPSPKSVGRNRLEQPTPATYFGNCIGARLAIVKTNELFGENGLIVVVEVLSEALETLKDGVLNGAEKLASSLLGDLAIADVKAIGAAGSPKFEDYSTDFGCGKPKKLVEMVSIDRTGDFCLSDFCFALCHKHCIFEFLEASFKHILLVSY
ncbi:anthocyanin acyltransferase, putative [Medicago truncatula]|uniref:Anthocyanin acyltransferase, putative n=1 Tax=Medicago truncatula TaxID=3880 RepID=G7L653_MEDTR|nr:anthocyanin acyltransferase, putative [Medicago truncatula]